MARKNGKRPGLSGQELKAFRHSVSQLKAKGLVSKRVDARSQKPTRYMQSKVKALSGVFDGTLAGVKVAPEIRRQYKDAGFPIYNGRVVFDKTRHETASVRKGLAMMRRPLGGNYMQERLILPYSPRNFNAFVSAVEHSPEKFNDLKEPNETFAFTFFGNWSYAHFDDIELVLDYLMAYSGLTNDNAQNEAWKNFVLYRITGEPPRSAQPRKQKPRSGPRVRGKMMGPELYRSKEAQRKREARADEGYRALERERDRVYQQQRRATLKALEDRNNKGGGKR